MPRGRPKLPDHERRDALLKIRVTNDERDEIRTVVPGMEFSDWGRSVLLRAARRLLKSMKRKRGS